MTTKNRSKPLRLLIADDDATLRLDLRHTLEGAGYAVIAEHGDGAQALQSARQLIPDLTILDIKMPGLDGIEVACALHENRIAPVVLLTAYDDRKLIRRAATVGVYSYLVKPFREASLIAAVEVAHSQWVDFQEEQARLERLKEKEETRALVECAKKVLIAGAGISETRAYRYIQKRSMSTRRPMRAIAEAILIASQVNNVIPADLAAEARQKEGNE